VSDYTRKYWLLENSEYHVALDIKENVGTRKAWKFAINAAKVSNKVIQINIESSLSWNYCKDITASSVTSVLILGNESQTKLGHDLAYFYVIFIASD
jgi:hypothetical protein